MKKLIVVAVMLVMAACGGGGAAPSSSTQTTTPTVTPTPTPTSFAISGNVAYVPTLQIYLTCVKAEAAPPTDTSCVGGSTGTTTTDASGNYSFKDVAMGFFYTVTPAPVAIDLVHYIFSPTASTFGLNANVTGVNFVASPCYSISGC